MLSKHPLGITSQMESFGRLFPIVEKFNGLLNTIVETNCPGVEFFYEEDLGKLGSELLKKAKAGAITLEEAREMFVNLDENTEQLIAQAKERAKKKLQ